MSTHPLAPGVDHIYAVNGQRFFTPLSPTFNVPLPNPDQRPLADLLILAGGVPTWNGLTSSPRFLFPDGCRVRVSLLEEGGTVTMEDVTQGYIAAIKEQFHARDVGQV